MVEVEVVVEVEVEVEFDSALPKRLKAILDPLVMHITECSALEVEPSQRPTT